MAENGKRERGKRKGKGKAEDKVVLLELIKSDAVTGQYKEGNVVTSYEMPQEYQQAFNNAWNAVRMNKQKQFKMDVDDLIKYSAGTPAEAAALDVHCDRAKITFGDLETKVEHKMCLLAWCGFQDRLEFAQYLIEMGADIDCGNRVVGSPLLQMMVLHDARHGAGELSIDVLRFFTEEQHSVLSRVISTSDDPSTFCDATVLTVALHMKRVDLAQYLFSKHKLPPVFCGSTCYPPVFLEYIEYGTFEVIPWLFTEGYESRDELVRFIDEVVDPAVLEAGLGEGGEVSPGSLMAAARRTGRSVAHALLLCANWKGTDMFTKKRPELISEVDSLGRSALYIAAETGFQKPVNILCDKCEPLVWVRDKAGVLPIMAAAKAEHKGAVSRILYQMLKDDALQKDSSVVADIKHCSLTSLAFGYYSYFAAFHCDTVSAYQVEALNLNLDVNGNSVTHIAAIKGREDIFKALLPTEVVDMIAILTLENRHGKTPLQLAVDRGRHSGVIEALPVNQTQFREAWKVYNDALLLYACVYGDVATVKAIMNLGSDSGTRSPLLLAARNGHAKVCRKLLDKGSSVNGPRDCETGYTPLMIAIDKGVYGKGNRDVVITILSDETQGMDAMRVCVPKSVIRFCKDDRDRETEDITTPMRMLIEEMPDVAEWIMNRSIYCSSEEDYTQQLSLAEIGSSAVIEYSFQFLEDFRDTSPVLPSQDTKFRRSQSYSKNSMQEPLNIDLDTTGGAREGGVVGKPEEVESTLINTEPLPDEVDKVQCSPPTVDNMDYILERRTSPRVLSTRALEVEPALASSITNDWGPTQYDRNHHPLHIMVKHKRADLLKHPLVSQLLEYKWRRVALPLFLGYMAVYLLFLLMLTLFALLSPRPSPDSDTCILRSPDSEIDVQNTNGTCDGLNVGREGYLFGSSVIIILISTLYLIVEVIHVVRLRKQYFTGGKNYVQVLTFVFSIIFVAAFGNECWCAPPWQWQIGALALFLAWFNLVILLKDLPFTGIPIYMLYNICLTFVKLVFLPLLLVVSFALPFYMLFVRDANSIEGDSAPGTLTAFLNLARALAKTVMQTAGDLDFEIIFNRGDLLYPPSAYLLFITFVVVMPVLFSNLLVGLAVGDTAKEKDKATFTRTRLQVEFILELEAMSSFLRRRMRPSDNKRRHGKKVGKLQQIYQNMIGLSYHTQVQTVKDLREKDEDFVDALNERGPTHELQVGVKGLRMKTQKVEEDVRAVRDEVEGRLGETLHSAEKHLCEVRSLLEQLTKSKSN